MSHSNEASAPETADWVYLDHNATSPLDRRVADAMAEWLRDGGNPSSLHGRGRRAREVLEQGRARVASFLGAEHPSEIVFGASGTEMNNTILRTHGPAGSHFVISTLEHPSIRVCAQTLSHAGVETTEVACGSDGRVAPENVVERLRPETRLVALMLANNEVGTIQDVAAVAAACRERGVAVLCDAVQAAGKIPFDVASLGADYVVIAGHKTNGPLGAAAAWVRPGAPFEALLEGGGQERRRRASTENVPACAGLGLACALVGDELEARSARMLELRNRFEHGLQNVRGAHVNCASSPRLPNTTNVGFEGVDAQQLLIRLDLEGFAVSTGSACASGSVEPSPTLLQLGLDAQQASSCLRVSNGLGNDSAQIDRFLEVLERAVGELRGARGYVRRTRGAVTQPADSAMEHGR